MADKFVEKDCFEMAKKDIAWLNDCKDVSKEDQERPDIILKKGEAYIGIEHFLVDTLQDQNKNSEGRQIQKIEKQIFDKYKDGKIVGNEVEALNEIGDLVFKAINSSEGYDCEDFQKSFLRIFVKHGKEIGEYKKKNIQQLGFLIEVTLPYDGYIFDIHRNEEWRREESYGVPVTVAMGYMMLATILLGWLDFVIITSIPIFNRANSHSVMYTKETLLKLQECDAFWPVLPTKKEQ